MQKYICRDPLVVTDHPDSGLFVLFHVMNDYTHPALAGKINDVEFEGICMSEIHKLLGD